MLIHNTIDSARAANRAWDIIIIGAGLAGSLAARELARDGAAVLLIDRACFPRTKVCGGYLNLRALSALAGVGLGNLVEQCGAKPVHSLRLSAPHAQAVVPVAGRALSRKTLDAALVRAAIQAGAQFLSGTPARLGEATDRARLVLLRQEGQEIQASARVVLGANGLAGSLLASEADHRNVVESGSRLGAGVMAEETPEFYTPGCIFMACGQGGYVGMVRHESGELNVAAAFDAAFVKQTNGLGNAAAAVLREGGFPPIDGLESLAWHGTPLLTRSVFPPAAERVFLLGDAAGYVEPFTGEGMAWGLVSATRVVPLALRACRQWDP